MKIKGVEVSKMQIGVLVIVWAAFLMTFLGRLAWPPIMPVAAKDLGISSKEAGSFMTAFYIGYVVTQLPGGLLTDRFGYRKVILVSFVLMGLSTALVGTIQSYNQGLIYRLISGLGSGSVYAACISAIFDWFPDKGRGTAMGFFFTASSLGVTTVNLLVPTVSSYFGWQGAFYFIGLLPMVALVFSLFLLKERKAATPRRSSANAVNFWSNLKSLLKNKNLMITACSGFWVMWATWGTATWANTYLHKALGLSLIQAGAIMSLYGLAALICKPVSGMLADIFRNRKKQLLFWMIILFAPLLLIFGLNTNTALLYVLAPLLGIFAFIYTPVLTLFVGEQVEHSQVASANGLVNTIQQLGALISPLTVGIVLDLTQSYFYAFATLAVGPVLSAVFLLLVKKEQAQVESSQN